MVFFFPEQLRIEKILTVGHFRAPTRHAVGREKSRIGESAFLKDPFCAGRQKLHDGASMVNNFSCGHLAFFFPEQLWDRKNIDRASFQSSEKTRGQIVQIVLYYSNETIFSTPFPLAAIGFMIEIGILIFLP